MLLDFFSLLESRRFDKHVMMFGAGMSSSVHIDNKKLNILILGKGLTDSSNDTALTAERNILTFY